MRFRSILLVLAAVGSASFSAAADSNDDSRETYRLRYRFSPNQLVYYDVSHETTIQIKAENTSERTRHNSNARKHYRVISGSDDGQALLELVIDRVKLSVQFGKSEPVVYDSTSSDPPPAQFRTVAESIGRPQARIRFAANGKLLSVTPLKPRDGGGQLPNAPKTPDNDPSHNFLVVFPEDPIAVGDTWTDRLTVQVRASKTLLRPVTLLRRYELTSVEDGVATISLKTSVLTPVRDPDIRTQLIQRTPAGTIRFDINRGVILSKTLTLDETEVGLFGGKGSMHVVSHRTERFVPLETAARQQTEKP